MTVLSRRGIEKTKDINMPLESKYWKLEKDLRQIIKFEVNIKFVNCCMWHVSVHKQHSFQNTHMMVLKSSCKTAEQQSYLQFMAAISFRYSALYTMPTVERANVSLQSVGWILNFSDISLIISALEANQPILAYNRYIYQSMSADK